METSQDKRDYFRQKHGLIPMLGKRRIPQQSGYRKKAKTYNRASREFGPGYNPKAMKLYKPMPGAELKYYEFGANASALTVAATTTMPLHAQVASLNIIAAGDDSDQRNGSKIQAKSITLRVGVGNARNSNVNWTDVVMGTLFYRVILYVDTQANGATPPPSDFFNDVPVNQANWLIYNNTKNSGRFKILWDKFITYDTETPQFESGAGQWYVAPGQRIYKKHFKLDMPIQYTTTAATAANIKNNNIGMWILCSGGNTTTATHKEYSFRAKLRYTDY